MIPLLTDEKQVLRDCINIIKGAKCGMSIHIDYMNETLKALRRILKADDKSRQKELF